MHAAILKPDSKGRITLGKLAKGVSSFRAFVKNDHIILEPYTEIPLREKWLYENPAILNRVQEGLRQSARGEVVSLGDFSKYIGENKDVDA